MRSLLFLCPMPEWQLHAVSVQIASDLDEFFVVDFGGVPEMRSGVSHNRKLFQDQPHDLTVVETNTPTVRIFFIMGEKQEHARVLTNVLIFAAGDASQSALRSAFC